jgi:hypothetical protein
MQGPKPGQAALGGSSTNASAATQKSRDRNSVSGQKANSRAAFGTGPAGPLGLSQTAAKCPIRRLYRTSARLKRMCKMVIYGEPFAPPCILHLACRLAPGKAS